MKNELPPFETFPKKSEKKDSGSFNFKVNILMKSHNFRQCCPFERRPIEHGSYSCKRIQTTLSVCRTWSMNARWHSVFVSLVFFSISFDTRLHVCQTLGSRMNRTIAAIWMNFESPLFFVIVDGIECSYYTTNNRAKTINILGICVEGNVNSIVAAV